MAVKIKPELAPGPLAQSEILGSGRDARPYFFWDRRITVAELRDALSSTDHPEHLDLLAHLLREARPDEVWNYVTPRQVAAEWPRLASRLGRRKEFWAWVIESWTQLGFLERGS